MQHPAPSVPRPGPRLTKAAQGGVADLGGPLGASALMRSPATTVRKGRLVLPPADAYVVVDGAVLSRLTIGPRVSTQLLGPGDLLLADPCRSDDLFQRDCRALLRSTITTVDLGRIARRYPDAAGTLVEAATRSASELAQQHVVAQLVDLEARVAALLPALAERWGVMSSQGILLPAFLSHVVMAELLGVRRPSFTAAVPRLAAEGLLERQEDGRWLLGRDLATRAGAYADATRGRR